ncbi:hypothetical protein MKX01_039064 [Papaver californicum]|nr:hypothetical protein MKX01_039064 [Papaver californicum]
MKGFLKYNLFLTLLLVFFFSYSTLLSHSISPAGTIERVTKQQVLASVLPLSHETAALGSSQLFLTSPSGKYSVFLLRRVTSFGAGGFGSDFCYIQVQDHGVSVWESECTPVSNVNTCTLVFTDGGLEIFDGSNSAWDNDVDGEYLRELVLIDSGDMQIRDREGEMVWRASDKPIVNQNCGSIGAPGMAPALPPFASSVHGDDVRGPFGQPLENNVQQGAGAQQAQLTVPQEELQQPEAANPQQQDGSSQPDETEAPALQPGAGNAADQQSTLDQPDELPQPALQPEAGLSQPGEDFQQPDLADPLSPVGDLSTQQPLSPSVHYQPAAAFGGGVGSASATQGMQQPLIDNTPFDSGSTSSMITKQSKLGVVLVTFFTLGVFASLF